MIKTLADLIQPMSEADFLARFVRKDVTFISGGARGDIESLLTLTDINAFLESETLRPPRVRLRRDDTPFPTDFFSDPESARLNSASIQDALRKGASLIIDDVGPLAPHLHWLERAIEHRLKGRTTVNAYISCNKGGAFAAHYDTHDVLIVQVHGRKLWQLFGKAEPSSASLKPWHRSMRPPPEVSWEGELQPGEILYIPRGTWHRAAVQGDICLHLTITIINPTGLDFANWIVEQLALDDLVGQDLPIAAGGSALANHEARLKSQIADVLNRFGLNDFLAITDGQRRTMTPFNLGEVWNPGDKDVLISALRRPLPPAAPDGSHQSNIQIGGQTQNSLVRHVYNPC